MILQIVQLLTLLSAGAYFVFILLYFVFFRKQKDQHPLLKNYVVLCIGCTIYSLACYSVTFGPFDLWWTTFLYSCGYISGGLTFVCYLKLLEKYLEIKNQFLVTFRILIFAFTVVFAATFVGFLIFDWNFIFQASNIPKTNPFMNALMGNFIYKPFVEGLIGASGILVFSSLLLLMHRIRTKNIDERLLFLGICATFVTNFIDMSMALELSPLIFPTVYLAYLFEVFRFHTFFLSESNTNYQFLVRKFNNAIELSSAQKIIRELFHDLKNQIPSDTEQQKSFRKTLDIYKGKLGFDKVAKEQFTISSELTLIESIYNSKLADKNISFDLDCADDFEVYGHSALLTIAFSNLMQNSIDADLGESPFIRIRTERKGPRYFIKFIDSGRGISPEIKAHLFELSFTSKKDSGNEGIGLNIAQENLLTLGGVIYYELDGEYTCFTTEFIDPT